MASGDSEQLSRIDNVVEAMRECLVNYLDPVELLKNMPSIDTGIKVKIRKTAMYDTKNAMEAILDHMNDHDDPSSLLIEIYKVLKLRGDDEDFLPLALISPNGISKWRNVSDMAKLFVELVDGHKFEKITQDTLHQVITVLKEEKIIVKKGNENIITKHPLKLKAFMMIIGLIRKGKSDWPFIVWNCLEVCHPSLFRAGTGLQTEHSSGVYSDFEIENPSISNSGLQTEHSSGVYSDFEIENPSIPNSGLQIEHLSGACSGLQIENPSIPGSEPSQSFSPRDYINKKQQSPKRKIDQILVTEESLPEINKLINIGSLERKFVRVTAESSDTRAGRKEDTESCGFSDDDETEVKRPMQDIQHLNLRGYQKELSEKALIGKNVIICAPTGSGKTRVATHIIIKHLEEGSKRKPRKVCFFARTVPLAIQQHKSISQHLPQKYKAFPLTGNSPYSTNLSAFLPVYDIIVLTPMILQNHFNRGLLKDLTVFTLLVFDECHHTRKTEPYNTLMLSYLKLKFENDSNLPQVVGLTASFPADKANSVDETVTSVLKICANMAAAEISTVEENKDELRQIVPVPDEEVHHLQEREQDASMQKIKAVMEKLETEAQEHGKAIKNPEITKLLAVGSIPSNKKNQQYNQWAVKLRKAAESVDINPNETLIPARLLMIIAEYLSYYTVALDAHDLVHLEDVLSYLDRCFKPFEEEELTTIRENRFYNYYRDLKKIMQSYSHEENPNLSKLRNVIETHLLSKGDQSRGIIFVKTRALAEALANWLDRCDNHEIVKLNATIFTGTNASESDGGMTQAQQDACIASFRKGHVRLLIATSVAEEGIDVPECNLVVRYNHVGNEISTIQTKGRSRKEGGCSVLMAMPDILNRELVNKDRARLMYIAVDKVRIMEESERLKRIEELQLKAVKDQELEELMEKERRRTLKDKKFKMFCKKCRKTCVESEYIKTIFGTHRVVTDWNIWKHLHIKGIPIKYVDEVPLVGSIRCRANINEKNALCKNKLGVLVVFSAQYFLALSIKQCVVVEENQITPLSFKQWKQMKYVVGDIETEDIKRYFGDSKRTDDEGAVGQQDAQCEVDRGLQGSTGDGNNINSGIFHTTDRPESREEICKSGRDSVQSSGSRMDEGAVCVDQEGDYNYKTTEKGKLVTNPAPLSSNVNTLPYTNLSKYIPNVEVSNEDNNSVNDETAISEKDSCALSSYNSKEDHHQTKLTSLHTVMENREKHEKKFEAELMNRDDEEHNMTEEEEGPMTCLTNAPSLNSN